MAKKKRRVAVRQREIIAIILISLAVLILVGLHSSAVGVVGSYLAYALRTTVGQAADLPPILLILWSFTLIREKKSAGRRRKASSLVILFAVFVTMLEIMARQAPPAETAVVGAGYGGGYIGRVLATLTLQAFGLTGSTVVLIGMTLIAAVLFFDTPLSRLIEAVITAVSAVVRSIIQGLALFIHSAFTVVSRWFGGWLSRKRRQAADAGRKEHRLSLRKKRAAKTENERQHTAVEPPFVQDDAEAAQLSMAPIFTDPQALPTSAKRRRQRKGQQEAVENPALQEGPDQIPAPPDVGPPADAADETEDTEWVAQTEHAEGGIEYRLPPITLFERNKERGKRRNVNVPDQRQLLEETLATFGVQAKVVSVSRGPVITRYEVQPAPGVAVKRITNLAKDLALNLAATAVRIEAPVPGKSVVGIEVPNKEINLVTFREVAETSEFMNAASKVSVIIGSDIGGAPVIGDLTKWLHVLIAGATGSGKSVCINSIICSLLMKAKPQEVKLLLIDPKRVELAVYDGIPHLISPVVTDPKQASGALRWAVKEMELRFKQFADRGVRNIDGYNLLVTSEEPAGEPLPYIVIIIDELADLMMVAKGDVEDSICRLAQMARAAGMYLMIATQRPSVDVITGLIKANVPSRIAFAVSSGTDSRTILDTVGAEHLLGKGDMLYHPIGAPKPIRAQGAFISDKEVQALVEFWKQQGEPAYEEDVLVAPTTDNDAAPEVADDELFADACRLVVETGNASISMVQRRFRVGYARAARLIDMMELRNIVGPYQGSKPREVLCTLEELEEMVL
ncbi:MAG: DNA translocase FtsK 4TM domain-containing protein [Limnochordia bacterium]|jgi:S-DNA-T family DNA segregation ATPase FtsK/SpoIIIE